MTGEEPSSAKRSTGRGSNPPDPQPPQSRQPADSPAARFAARLRELRGEAGSPTFRQLAKATHYSASTLAEATVGRRLPSEPVVKAFVIACGADPEQWLAELREAARAVRAEAAAPRPDEPPGQDAEPPANARRERRWPAALLAVGLVVGFGAGFGVFEALAPGRDALQAGASATAVTTFSVSPAPTSAHAVDGDDPTAAGCAKDAVLVDKQAVMRGSVQIGALELEYSAFCDAGWTRIFLYPGQPVMLGYVQIQADDGRSSAFEDPLVRQISVYTNVIVRAAGGCLSGRAVFYETGEPPATASIACQAPSAR